MSANSFLKYFEAIDRKNEAEALNRFIEMFDIRYINNTFFCVKENNAYGTYTKQELIRHRMFWNQHESVYKTPTIALASFVGFLYEHHLDRIHKSVCITTKPETFSNHDVFNMFQIGEIISPRNTGSDVHPLLRAVMTSISNNNPEIEEHIIRCLLTMIKNPHDAPQLPAICWYGCGRAGKNLFVDVILSEIFGKGLVISDSYQNLFTGFNNLLMNRIVVHIDENKAKKSETRKLKSVVSNATIKVSQKFKDTIISDNIAWYFLSTNDDTPPVVVDGNVADERWSIIRLDHPLAHYLKDQMSLEGYADNQIKAYVKNNLKYIKDHDAIAQLLYEYDSKYQLQDTVGINAWHDENYRRIVSKDLDFETQFFDALINSRAFGSIGNRDAYQFYKHCGGKLNDSHFGRQFKHYIYKNRVVIGGKYRYRTSAAGRWHLDGYGPPLEMQYLHIKNDQNGRPVKKLMWEYSMSELQTIADSISNKLKHKPIPVRQFDPLRVVSEYRRIGKVI